MNFNCHFDILTQNNKVVTLVQASANPAIHVQCSHDTFPFFSAMAEVVAHSVFVNAKPEKIDDKNVKDCAVVSNLF